MMRLLSWIFTLAIVLFALGFAVENSGNVDLILWPFRMAVTLPLPVVMFGFLFAGLLVGSFLTWLGSFRYLWQIRSLRRDLAVLHKQINAPPANPPAACSRFRFPCLFRRQP